MTTGISTRDRNKFFKHYGRGIGRLNPLDFAGGIDTFTNEEDYMLLAYITTVFSGGEVKSQFPNLYTIYLSDGTSQPISEVVMNDTLKALQFVTDNGTLDVPFKDITEISESSSRTVLRFRIRTVMSIVYFLTFAR